MNAENIFLIVASLGLLGFAIHWLKSRRKGQGDPRQVAREALSGCACLIDLIANIQQHRGMSSAHLAGNSDFDLRLVNKRSEIAHLLDRLKLSAEVENKSPYPCFTRTDFDLLRHRWEVLIERLDSHTVESAIAAHTQLVATLLNWLDALGEARIELPMKKQLPLGSIRNYAHRLPQMAEYLGQARATGSGVAAQGVCSAVARVRLMFLVARAESLVEQAAAVNPRGLSVSTKVKKLAELTRSNLLGGHSVSISASDYFAEATAAIDAVFAWISEYSNDIEAHIARM